MSRAFFKYAIAVERLTTEAGSKEAYTSNGTIYGTLMSIAPEDTMISEGNPSQSAVLLCEEQSDIKIGDRVTLDSLKYIVKGVKNPKMLFSICYKRCVVEKLKA